MLSSNHHRHHHWIHIIIISKTGAERPVKRPLNLKMYSFTLVNLKMRLNKDIIKLVTQGMVENLLNHDIQSTKHLYFVFAITRKFSVLYIYISFMCSCRLIMAHNINPSTWEAEAGGSRWVRDTSLVYRDSSKTNSKKPQTFPVSKNKK